MAEFRKELYDLKGKTLYKQDIKFDEESGFCTYKNMKVCGYIVDEENGIVCKKRPMANGRCLNHGGSKVRGMTKELVKRVNDVIPMDLPANSMGDKFEEKYNRHLLNPELFDFKQDIAKVVTMMDLLINKLDEKNVVGLSSRIGRLAEISASIKEKYHKVCQSYIDLFTVKFLIVQLNSIIVEFINSVSLLVEGEDNLKKLEQLREKVVEDIEGLRLPVMKD